MRHRANIHAARARHIALTESSPTPPPPFATWLNAEYGRMWNEDFTEAQRAAVLATYGKALDSVEDWQKAFEGLRMLSQARAEGGISEAAKVWTMESGKTPQSIIDHFRRLLEVIKQWATEGELPEAIEADLVAIESLLNEWASTPTKTATPIKPRSDSLADRILGDNAIIPEGNQITLSTPRQEMRVNATATAVSLDQLVGSSDPRFPGKELQPHDRTTGDSAAQSVEMMRNLENNPDQWRRYHESPASN